MSDNSGKNLPVRYKAQPSEEAQNLAWALSTHADSIAPLRNAAESLLYASETLDNVTQQNKDKRTAVEKKITTSTALQAEHMKANTFKQNVPALLDLLAKGRLTFPSHRYHERLAFVSAIVDACSALDENNQDIHIEFAMAHLQEAELLFVQSDALFEQGLGPDGLECLEAAKMYKEIAKMRLVDIYPRLTNPFSIENVSLMIDSIDHSRTYANPAYIRMITPPERSNP